MGLGITDGSLSLPQASFILLTADLLDLELGVCASFSHRTPRFTLYSQARLLIGEVVVGTGVGRGRCASSDVAPF